MDLNQLALTILLGASKLLDVQSVPQEPGAQVWQVEGGGWRPAGGTQSFAAVNETLVTACAKFPNGFVHFPSVIHGAQYIYLDGRQVAQFGDRSFRSFQSFYGAPVVACQLLQEGKVLRWEAYSYTQYFARFDFFPRFDFSKGNAHFFQETINVIAAGFLLLMAVINFIIFFRKIPNGLAVSFALSNFFFAGFFFFAVASYFGVGMPMLRAHILADSSLFVGVALFFNCMRLRGLISQNVLLSFLGIKIISMGIFITADAGDTVQFATTLTFPLALNLIFWGALPLFKALKENRLGRGGALQFISLGCFMATIVNDILVVLGLLPTYPMLAVGSVGALLFASLSLNEHLIATYMERDYLRQNLELEVERKTFELRRKSQELEDALGDLKNTQAELVQSAKLASLGTLSAGIAHEINNSLNYVNGAIAPLEMLIEKSEAGPRQNKMQSLVGVMREGLRLTFEIMDSLRNYSGLNQAKFRDVSLRQVIDSVLVMLRNRLDGGGYTVSVAVDKQLVIFGNIVGLSQTFMNLFLNAIDAMPQGGELRVDAVSAAGVLTVSVSDTGAGMSGEVLDRVFEPFFTTKDVGKGTGLGLHIVRQEVEKHAGRISITSTPQVGTVVTMKLPVHGAAVDGGERLAA